MPSPSLPAQAQQPAPILEIFANPLPECVHVAAQQLWDAGDKEGAADYLRQARALYHPSTYLP